jgi:hypothetical protein
LVVHRAWFRGAGLITLLALAAWGWRTADAVAQREHGAALFGGKEALAGRLLGHEQPLPGLATRCSNCHDAVKTGPGATSAVAASTPPLTAVELSTPRSRRGGPPSAFDASRLCALLRNGTDPAHVIISTTMPRYQISDEQCRALWSYLLTR